MRIRIIANDNGYGLSKDRQVLASVLTGHEVIYSHPSKADSGSFDVNFHIEHILQRNVQTAPINIAIPNPEWCSRHMVNGLSQFTAVFAKTRQSEEIFSSLDKCPVYFTSWSSPDPYDDSIERKRHVLHMAGLSPMKSTHAVVDAMSHLPNINGTCYYRRGSLPNTPNFIHLKQVQPQAHINRALNEAGIHVLPSQAEGFGHALNEALACGATVITTAAPPMSELGAQYHVRITGHHMHNLAPAYHLDPTDLRRAIQMAWDNYAGFDTASRERYLARDKSFREWFANALDQVVPRQAA